MSEKSSKAKGAGTLMRYFGKLPGQSVKDFADETKKLTDQDVADLVDGIKSETYTY